VPIPPDMSRLSSLSRKQRILALVMGVLTLVLLAFNFLVLSKKPPAALPLPPVVHHTTPAKPAGTKKHSARPPAPKLDPGLPDPLRRALLHSNVVVAVLYAADAPGDRDALGAARAGARTAHVGFAVLDVRNEAVAEAVATLALGTTDPSVLVFRRPGTIAVKLDGFSEADVVAQAAGSVLP
jgi:hypothetical protein